MHSLVSDLSDLKEATASAYITLLYLIGSAHNSGTNSTGHSVVVALPQPSEAGDVCLCMHIYMRVWKRVSVCVCVMAGESTGGYM